MMDDIRQQMADDLAWAANQEPLQQPTGLADPEHVVRIVEAMWIERRARAQMEHQLALEEGRMERSADRLAERVAGRMSKARGEAEETTARAETWHAEQVTKRSQEPPLID